MILVKLKKPANIFLTFVVDDRYDLMQGALQERHHIVVRGCFGQVMSIGHEVLHLLAVRPQSGGVHMIANTFVTW